MTLLPRSIKGRLFLWYSAVVFILMAVLSFVVFYEVRLLIFSAVDQALHSKMQLATGLMHEEHEKGEDGEIEVEIGELVTGEYAIPRSGHYYKVVVEGMETVYSPSLGDPNFDLSAGRLESYNKDKQLWVYMSAGPRGEPIRVLRHDLRYLGRAITIYVAEDISASLKRIEYFRLSLLITAFLTTVAISLIGIWIIWRSLMPLQQFCSGISRISSKNLSERVDSGKTAKELQGLAQAFNGMLDRLQRSFDAER
ncbi:MAG: HAMP domain-containing protein, partial [Nitrospirales bacterium]|nr:HAMP domain-containing protein [Nitrospirales bacterium]